MTIKLNEETEKQLAEILLQENCSDKTKLIEQLIRDRWLALQAEKTVVKRRRGHLRISCKMRRQIYLFFREKTLSLTDGMNHGQGLR